uniref:Putative LOV domain-containing protein n=1 Tax=Sargassum hemiphyllum TaxID=127544 RepID=A0A126X307_SARHM|nr:putative LOV domain-containing protein [Sargassum hemiphyllum]
MNQIPQPPLFGSMDPSGGSMANKLINIDDILRDFIDLDGNDLPGLDEGGGGEGEDVGSTNSNIIGGGIGGDDGVSERIKSEGFEGTETGPVPMSTQQQQRQPSSGHSMIVGGGPGHQGEGVGVNLGGIGRAGAGIPEISPTTDAAEAVAVSGRGRGSAPAGGGRAGRGRGVTKVSARPGAVIAGGDEDGRQGRRGGGKRPRQGGRNMTEQQRLDRRERNREHAKRSRVRKKFLLESLQKSVTALQEENEKLRGAIRSNLGPEEAKELLTQTETSSLISSSPGEATKVLDDPDYSLVKALQTAQQNFVITDPTLPDNPIVFASQGFLELTGYTLDQVLGRNCRFLQGPDTDPKAVEKIRKAIEKGMDTSVCLRNYRVDGAMFWNQFFIAALRDSEGTVINYVGVQCKVDEDFVRAAQKREEGEGDGDMDDDEEEEEGDEDRSDAEEKDAAVG